MFLYNKHCAGFFLKILYNQRMAYFICGSLNWRQCGKLPVKLFILQNMLKLSGCLFLTKQL